MPEPTPGQIAYAACLATLAPQAPWRLAWHELSEEYHRAWEAAALAVLTHVDTQRALACDVHEAAWAQIARCNCDLRVPVGSLCASCESLKSIADAAQEEP